MLLETPGIEVDAADTKGLIPLHYATMDGGMPMSVRTTWQRQCQRPVSARMQQDELLQMLQQSATKAR